MYLRLDVLDCYLKFEGEVKDVLDESEIVESCSDKSLIYVYF